jgi:hypothetical protein
MQDTAKLVNVTVALEATSDGVSFVIELDADSTLTVELGSLMFGSG